MDWGVDPRLIVWHGATVREVDPGAAAEFHRVYYDSLVWRGDTTWLGVTTQKTPQDLWCYQEILYSTKPDLIIETGTASGGSAYFLACVCSMIHRGRVLSVDIAGARRRRHRWLDAATGLKARRHWRVDLLVGDSTDPTIFEKIKRRARGKRVMVVLDSDHSEAHVSRELSLYADLVAPGCYLIVEDTNVNGHPVFAEHGPGPFEAVQRFLGDRSDFVVDDSREKFGFTFNPGGFLRRE